MDEDSHDFAEYVLNAVKRLNVEGIRQQVSLFLTAVDFFVFGKKRPFITQSAFFSQILILLQKMPVKVKVMF